MKVEITTVPTMSIQEFADKHKLEMCVTERERPADTMMRFYARFKGAEVRSGTCMLKGEHGNGPTPEFAMREYAKAISCELLIVDAMSKDRREIRVPRLTFDPNRRSE